MQDWANSLNLSMWNCAVQQGCPTQGQDSSNIKKRNIKVCTSSQSQASNTGAVLCVCVDACILVRWSIWFVRFSRACCSGTCARKQELKMCLGTCEKRNLSPPQSEQDNFWGGGPQGISVSATSPDDSKICQNLRCTVTKDQVPGVCTAFFQENASFNVSDFPGMRGNFQPRHTTRGALASIPK